MMWRVILAWLLMAGMAHATCPAVPADCPSPTYNTLTSLDHTTTNLTVSNTLTFTNLTIPGTLTASGVVTGSGMVDRFATPGPIGSTLASTGAFTTLSASGTVSGAGFTARFASPGPIGSSTPSTGAFTTLTASGQFGSTASTTASSLTDGWLVNAVNALNYPTSGAWVDRLWRTTATLTADTSGIWQPNFVDCITQGAHTQSGESNCIHPQTTFGAGMTLSGTHETIEASLVNNATISGGWIGALVQITSNSGTISSATMIDGRYFNDNATANSIGVLTILGCEGKVGGAGSAAQFSFCVRNSDAASMISTLGDVQIGTLGADLGFSLYIKGKDNLAGTFNTVIQSNAGSSLLAVSNAGGVAIPNYLSIGVSVPVPGIPLYVQGANTSGASFSLVVKDSLAASLLAVANDGGVSIPGLLSPGAIAMGGAFTNKAKTVATLPTCNSGTAGNIYAVTDANAPAWHANVAGGGAVYTAVYCDTTWKAL